MPGLRTWVYAAPSGSDAHGGDVHYLSLCPACTVSRIALADVSGHGQAVVALGERLRELSELAMPATVAPHKTRIDVPPAARDRLVPLLNASLADLIDLFNQTKHAHWNVKGASFIALHELFDDVAERVEEHCDLLAERVVALGGTAHGTTRQSASALRLAEYDVLAVEGDEHVRALSGQIAAAGATIRHAIQESTDLGDPTTADLFTEISRSLDKDLWFLEAHLQGRPER